MTTATAAATKPKYTKPRVADQQMLIGGKWVNSVSGKTFDTINPATSEVICKVAEGDKADIDLAVKAARDAFETGPWSRMNASGRGRLLNKLADAIESHKEELAALESLDNGKPIADSLAADLPLTIQCYRYYAGWA
ncbi:MAG TPA: aldehyde dehydrogenase family protein, partial [Gemmata sp.]|nr:aldehyde dehydrogenase family protein [Gemmata sp.]